MKTGLMLELLEAFVDRLFGKHAAVDWDNSMGPKLPKAQSALFVDLKSDTLPVA